MKPSIVILSAFLSPLRSGAEACSEEISKLLSSRYDFTVITAKMRRDLPREDTISGNVRVLRIGIGSSIDKWLFPFIAPFAVRRIRPKIVHAILESFAGLALVFCKFICPQSRRLLTCQSTNTKFLVSLMHRFAERITAISSVLLERGRKIGRSDLVLIPNGIHYEEIRAACKQTPKVSRRILFVGRMEPMKGVDTLLSALQEVSANMDILLDVHLVGDGKLRRKFEEQAEKFLPRKAFLGFVPQPAVYREFAEAEIFCAFSRSEALGNVFLEAQASGCAVIATSVGGIPEVIKQGVTGILVPVDDVASAAKEIRRLLSDPSLLRRLSEAAIEHVKRYDWRFISEQYAAIYDQLLR